VSAAEVISLMLLASTKSLPNTAQQLLYTGILGTLATPTVATPTLPTPTSASPSPTHSTASASSATPTVASPAPICVNYTSYIQGTWGQACRTTQTSASYNGCYRDTNFVAAFSSDIQLGCPLTTSPEFRRLNFTTSYAISLFLPVLAPPTVLTTTVATTTNPLSFTAGVGGALAGNLLAAKLNVGFDLFDATFSQCTGHLADLCFHASDPHVGATCGLHTLANVIKAADLILGACSATNICNAQFVDPTDAALCLLTPTQINQCLYYANSNYGNGDQATMNVLVPCT